MDRRSAGNANARELAEVAALERAGRYEEAESRHRAILERRPDSRTSLQFLAGRAYKRGDYETAAGYTRRYLALDPDNGDALSGLGQMLEHLGRHEEAIGCYARLLRVAPADPRSLIFLGDALARAGEEEAAVACASLVEPGVRQLLATRLESAAYHALRARAERLAACLAEHRRAVIDRGIAPLARPHPETDTARIARVRWRPRESDYGADRRRPNYFYVPGLPDRPWFEAVDFEWATELEAKSDALAAEAAAELDLERDLEAYIDAHLGRERDWKRLAGRTDWGALHFYNAARRNDAALARFPRIAETLAGLPLAEMWDTPVEALLSVLKPGTEIPSHVGMANHRLTVHLPLIVPGECGVEVAGEVRSTEAGRLLIFDDSYRHRAWNRSDRARVVLIFEVWHPDLSAAERDGIARMTEEMAAFEAKRQTIIREAVVRAAAPAPSSAELVEGKG